MTIAEANRQVELAPDCDAESKDTGALQKSAAIHGCSLEPVVHFRHELQAQGAEVDARGLSSLQASEASGSEASGTHARQATLAEAGGTPLTEIEERERGVADITEAEKYEFLQLARQGLDRQEAAAALGYKARPWRSLTSPLSRFYDEEFTRAYGEAKSSPEAALNYQDRLRERINQFAMAGEVRLLEKLAIVHLPEWRVLRERDKNVNVRVVFQQYLKDLPTELLERVLAEIEGRDIVDGEVSELPPAVTNGDEGDD